MVLDVQTLLSVSTLALSAYAVAGALIIKTENIISSVIFKVIPFVLGVSTTIFWAANAGWIGRTAGM